MIKCEIKYHFNSNKRVARFRKFAKFAALPPEGSQLSILDGYPNDEYLTVDGIIMGEELCPVLVVESSDIKDRDIENAIDFMKEAGWDFMSVSNNTIVT